MSRISDLGPRKTNKMGPSMLIAARIDMSDINNTGKTEYLQRYRIRYAAGTYWIIDMQQEGLIFRMPAAGNECTVFLFERFLQGMSEEELTCELCREFDVDKEEAAADVAEFIVQAAEYLS